MGRNEEDPRIRFWLWLISDFTVKMWMFALWMLTKKLWISATVALLESKTNAAMSLVCQLIDSSLLLAVQPYNEFSSHVTKNMGEVSNLLTYAMITVPILFELETPGTICTPTHEAEMFMFLDRQSLQNSMFTRPSSLSCKENMHAHTGTHTHTFCVDKFSRSMEKNRTTLKTTSPSPIKHTKAHMTPKLRVLHTIRATGLKISLIFHTHVNRGPGRLDHTVHKHHRYQHRCSLCSCRHYQVSLGSPQV